MKKRILLITCAVILFLFAAIVTVYPLISNYLDEKYQSFARAEYNEVVAQAYNTEIQAAWAAARDYNASLQPVHFDAESMQEAQQDYHALLNLAENDIMGYVEVPKINVYLPVYHGTGAEILNDGIGHLLGSSLPVGGTGTHTILTGHSGVAGKRLFSDLDQMAVGDVFYLHILDETLDYEVMDIHTVKPYDTTYLPIEDGKDRCTLITCTPFGVNTHRLLVQGDRIPYEEAKQTQETVAETTPATPSTWKQQYYQGLFLGARILAVIAVGVVLILLIARKRRRHHAQE